MNKNDRIISLRIEYFKKTFDILSQEGNIGIISSGSYKILDDETFIINYYTKMEESSQAVTNCENIPIKSKKLKKIIHKNSLKIDFRKFKKQNDKCYLCLNDNICYTFCCGKICRECFNCKTLDCIICKKKITF